MESSYVLDDYSPKRIRDRPADFGTLEGECYLLTKADRHKKHWITLIGNELYCYKTKDDSHHLLMHSLAGTFISELPEEKATL